MPCTSNWCCHGVPSCGAEQDTPNPFCCSRLGTKPFTATKTFLRQSPIQNERGVMKQKVKIIPCAEETSAAARLHFISNLVYKVPPSGGENLRSRCTGSCPRPVTSCDPDPHRTPNPAAL